MEAVAAVAMEVEDEAVVAVAAVVREAKAMAGGAWIQTT